MRALRLAGRGKPISAILSIGTRLDCRSWLDSEPSMLVETVSEEGSDVEEEEEDGLSERTYEIGYASARALGLFGKGA